MYGIWKNHIFGFSRIKGTHIYYESFNNLVEFLIYLCFGLIIVCNCEVADSI